VIALLLVAFSLGLSNFAAAISIGVSGITSRQRLEVGIAFGVFEAGMPVVGFIVGHQLAHDLGHAARWFGGSILIGTGVYALVEARRPTRPVAPAEADRRFRIAITALALSIDNLAVGFALGTRHISLALLPS
jgi:putative Mn2+ efflux pump MntP